MLIDWFTVVAQVVNFLILILLLRLFLYGPIVRAMDKREEKIAARLQEGEEKAEQAEEEAERYRRERRDLEQRREDLLSEAKQEADERRRRLLEEAREEIEATRKQWRESVEREHESFLRDLRRRIAGETYAIARKALEDLADASLEAQMVDRFVAQLRESDSSELARLAEAADESDGVLTLRCRFEIDEEMRDLVAEAVRDQIGDGFELQFETVPDLISGIELRANGLKVAWSLDEYLDRLEESIGEALEQEWQPISEEES